MKADRWRTQPAASKATEVIFVDDPIHALPQNVPPLWRDRDDDADGQPIPAWPAVGAWNATGHVLHATGDQTPVKPRPPVEGSGPSRAGTATHHTAARPATHPTQNSAAPAAGWHPGSHFKAKAGEAPDPSSARFEAEAAALQPWTGDPRRICFVDLQDRLQCSHGDPPLFPPHRNKWSPGSAFACMSATCSSQTIPRLGPVSPYGIVVSSYVQLSPKPKPLSGTMLMTAWLRTMTRIPGCSNYSANSSGDARHCWCCGSRPTAHWRLMLSRAKVQSIDGALSPFIEAICAPCNPLRMRRKLCSRSSLLLGEWCATCQEELRSSRPYRCRHAKLETPRRTWPGTLPTPRRSL